MKNTKLELFNSLTNDNQFIVLFIGKNSQYNDMVQRVYNLHWNSIVTTFNLDENRCGISANQFNELENYRKVFPIGIEDSENRKNLFNKKKLTPISVVSCIEKKQAQYKRTFNKYLDKLHDRLSVGGTLIVDGFTVEEYERLNLAEYISDLGTDIVFVVDTSPSMSAKDVDGGQRLDAAKNAIYLLTGKNDGSRHGLQYGGSCRRSTSARCRPRRSCHRG